MLENIDYIVCPICNKQLKILNIHIIKYHKISIDEFKKTYPLNKLICLNVKNNLIIEANKCREIIKNKKIYNYCLNCGNICNKKFCNFKCQQNFKTENKITLWKNGLLDNKHIIKTNGQIKNLFRNYLLQKFSNKCSICGWDKINKTSGKCPLEIEHIDGNSNNNTEENLTVLCPNCHSLTSTYKSLNKGNGRKQRMKRYYQGKTF